MALRAPVRARGWDDKPEEQALASIIRVNASNGGAPPKAGHLASSGGQHAQAKATSLQPKLMMFILLTLTFGVGNRLLYKMALVPMGHYTVFLAQFQNVGYLVVYFSCLWMRARSGVVTKQMLAIDKKPFLVIGVCEAVSQLLFMFTAARLPGAILPIINQSSLVWNMIFAAMLLHSRFSRTQLAGASLITLGVVLAAAPPALWDMFRSLRGVAAAGGAAPVAMEPMYVFLGVLSFAFPAVASIIKDAIFRKQRERLGQPLDIFIVNSFGSLCQFMFVPLLLPMTIRSNGMNMSELPAYLAEGAQCFAGHAASGKASCSGAPLLPIAYVVVNLAYNISMLNLQRHVGAVTSTIVSSCLVPLTILAFALPIPLLPPAVMGPGFLVGTFLLCFGLTVYNREIMLQPLLKMAAGSSSRLTSKLNWLLQFRCGYAKFVGESVEYTMRKYEVILGRTSKGGQTDVVLGNNMNISRQHARVYYNFDTKNFELTVMGKNGVTVGTTLYTPASPPLVLKSQDMMAVGDKVFYFLLPKPTNQITKRDLEGLFSSSNKRPRLSSAQPAAGGPSTAPAQPAAPSDGGAANGANGE